MKVSGPLFLACLALAACRPAPPPDPAPAAAPAAAPEPAQPPGADAGLGAFSRAPQQVGTPTDGAALEAIRRSAHPGFYRFVFDLDGDVVAASEARLAPDGLSLTVELHGLRHDRTGNRPLTTESGSPFGQPVAVGTPPVRSYGRAQVLDDSQLRYEIQLERAADFRLGALEAPPRVVLDIAR